MNPFKMSLTEGVLARICAGEAVHQPNLQVLEYAKIHTATCPEGRYRLRLSDGEHTYTGVMLSPQLNPLIHDGELDQFTIIRLDKYVVKPQVDSDLLNSIIILLEVSVVQPGYKVGYEFGNPQNEIPFLPQNPTRGALARICAGEDVSEPNLQVLAYEKVLTDIDPLGAGAYGLLLSDGEHTYNGVMLSTQLNSMIHDGKLEKFTIIRVDKYVNHQVGQGDGAINMIILFKVSVVQPGHKVGDKFGIPKNEIPFKVKTDQPMGGTLENDGQHEVNEERKVQAICRKLENDGPHEVNDERKGQAIGSNLEKDEQNKGNEGTKGQIMGSNLANGQKGEEEDLVINNNHENDGENKEEIDYAICSNLENENDGQHVVNEAGEDKKKVKKMKPKCARSSCENQGRHRCSRCKAVYYCQQECLEEDWSHHKVYCDYVYKANKVPTDSNNKDTEEMENSEGVEEVD